MYKLENDGLLVILKMVRQVFSNISKDEVDYVESLVNVQPMKSHPRIVKLLNSSGDNINE